MQKAVLDDTHRRYQVLLLVNGRYVCLIGFLAYDLYKERKFNDSVLNEVTKMDPKRIKSLRGFLVSGQTTCTYRNPVWVLLSNPFGFSLAFLYSRMSVSYPSPLSLK